MTVKYFLMALSFALLQLTARSQQRDTVSRSKDSSAVRHMADTVRQDLLKTKPKQDPHKASIYSAVLPGAGQVYNRKYWKVPIVYAALGIPAYAFFYNKQWYNKCQYALVVQSNGSSADSLQAVDPKLRQLAGDYGNPSATNSLVNYRNEFRKNQDYSALFFLLFWALNIVDATVDAHLKGFNVTDDLSLQIKPAMLMGTRAAGISFVFDLHKAKPRLLDGYR